MADSFGTAVKDLEKAARDLKKAQDKERDLHKKARKAFDKIFESDPPSEELARQYQRGIERQLTAADRELEAAEKAFMRAFEKFQRELNKLVFR